MPGCPTANSRCCAASSPASDSTAIADALHLSVKTISTHKTRIMEKLQLASTAALIRYAIEHRLHVDEAPAAGDPGRWAWHGPCHHCPRPGGLD